MVEHSTAESEVEMVPRAESSRSEISRIMAEMGRKGGKIGKRRLKTMTKAERSESRCKSRQSAMGEGQALKRAVSCLLASSGS